MIWQGPQFGNVEYTLAACHRELSNSLSRVPMQPFLGRATFVSHQSMVVSPDLNQWRDKREICVCAVQPNSTRPDPTWPHGPPPHGRCRCSPRLSDRPSLWPPGGRYRFRHDLPASRDRRRLLFRQAARPGHRHSRMRLGNRDVHHGAPGQLAGGQIRLERRADGPVRWVGLQMSVTCSAIDRWQKNVYRWSFISQDIQLPKCLHAAFEKCVCNKLVPTYRFLDALYIRYPIWYQIWYQIGYQIGYQILYPTFSWKQLSQKTFSSK